MLPQAVATELKAKYGKAETMCIACDVGAADMAGSIRAITQPLAGKKVTMLVNNVGVAAEFPAGSYVHSWRMLLVEIFLLALRINLISNRIVHFLSLLFVFSTRAELTDHSTAEVESIIRVNCLFTAQLTRAFVPILKANASPRAAIVGA